MELSIFFFGFFAQNVEFSEDVNLIELFDTYDSHKLQIQIFLIFVDILHEFRKTFVMI